MTTYPIVFVIKVEHGPLNEALEVIAKIKEIHPDAKITVEVEV